MNLKILTRCGEYGKLDLINYEKMLNVYKDRYKTKNAAPKTKL